jgi:Histidine kinase-like ATPase domain
MPTASGTPGQGKGSTSPASPLAPDLRWRRVFPGHERELSDVRRWLSLLLPDCPARDSVLSVATELGSNAIQHTASGRGGWFAVEISWHPSAVQVAIADSGSPAEPYVIDEPAGERGRGLLLVRGLSVRTGHTGDQRGRLVWAQIPWDGPSPATAASSQDPYQTAIRDGEATLARRFAGVPAWFGRSTLAWWAMAGPDGLVSAPSARELAGLLYRLLDSRTSYRPPAVGHTHPGAAEKPAQQSSRGPGAARLAPSPGRSAHATRTGTGRPGTPDGQHPARGNRPAFIPELLTTGAAGPACA